MVHKQNTVIITIQCLLNKNHREVLHAIVTETNKVTIVTELSMQVLACNDSSRRQRATLHSMSMQQIVCCADAESKLISLSQRVSGMHHTTFICQFY